MRWGLVFGSVEMTRDFPATAPLGSHLPEWRGAGGRMRILMVTARYAPFVGGIESHVREVGPRMGSRGHEVTVLTTDPGGRLPVEEWVAGMRVRRVNAWPTHRDYYFAPGVYTEISRGRWDIVHVQGYGTFVAPLAMAAAIRCDIPFVLTFHSGGHSSAWRNAIRGAQRTVLSPLARRAGRLIGVSQFEADFFSRKMRLDRQNWSIVPNGASLPAPRCAGRQRSGNLVVSIGRLERYKGHHKVIEAFPDLLSVVPDAHLKIVGTGPYERPLRRLVDRLGLADRVAFESYGPTERQQLATVLASAGLVVLLSEYEAHPVAVMEALALRCRVLVTETSGLQELAQKGLCRSIPMDAAPGAAAAAMAEELGSAREVPPLSLPDWDTCAQQLLDIYDAVLRTAARGRPPAPRNGSSGSRIPAAGDR